MRLDKPAGYFAFYFPHVYGLLFAQAVSTSSSFQEQIGAHFCILLGSLFLRGAACTWNDVLNAPYDRQVARCRLRPIARHTVSRPAALLFMVTQTALGVMLTLAPHPHECQAPAISLIATQAVYPLCKRFTNYSQLLLGISFAMGLGVGAGGGGLDVGGIMNKLVAAAVSSGDFTQGIATLTASERLVLGSLTCLFVVIVLNTLIYDTIYGHQIDDMKAGVKSLAVAWRDDTKRNCAILAIAEIALLVAISFIAELGVGFDILGVCGTALVLTIMLYRVRLDDPGSCMWCFNWLVWGTGVTLMLGLISACV